MNYSNKSKYESIPKTTNGWIYGKKSAEPIVGTLINKFKEEYGKKILTIVLMNSTIAGHGREGYTCQYGTK